MVAHWHSDPYPSCSFGLHYASPQGSSPGPSAATRDSGSLTWMVPCPHPVLFLLPLEGATVLTPTQDSNTHQEEMLSMSPEGSWEKLIRQPLCLRLLPAIAVGETSVPTRCPIPHGSLNRLQWCPCGWCCLEPPWCFWPSTSAQLCTGNAPRMGTGVRECARLFNSGCCPVFKVACQFTYLDLSPADCALCPWPHCWGPCMPFCALYTWICPRCPNPGTFPCFLGH